MTYTTAPTPCPEILGKFDAIEVFPDHAHHCGRDIEITFLNPYAFYFKWDEGNQQIWILRDSALLQIGNDKNSIPHIMDRAGNFHLHAEGAVKPLVGNPIVAALGHSTTVSYNQIHHCGSFRDIVWLNPNTFLFVWSMTNIQIWTFDVKRSGYIQMGIWDNAVTAAMTEEKRLYAVLH